MVIKFEEANVEVSNDGDKWQAVLEENIFPIGYGSTMMEAIADLREKME